MAIGCKVTLRGDRMYEFVDRLVTIALPRVKDFRGLNAKSFDGRGNFAMGLKEHIVFPEIDYDQVDEVWGMDVIVCTTAGNDDEARALLRGFNFPFRTPSSAAGARFGRALGGWNGQAEFGQQEQPPQEAGRALCGQAQGAEGRRRRSDEAGGSAFRGAAEAGAAAAQLVGDAHSQPLRADGARARLLPQAAGVPQHAARAGEPGA